MKKPYQTYFGGKGGDGVFQTTINHIPPHDIFISGCLGNCAIMHRKKPAPFMNIGIDVDAQVIADWNEIGMFSYFFECMDVVEYLSTKIHQLIKKNNRIFIYLDPPYLGTTRKRNQRRYTHEMLTEADHASLLCVIVDLAQQYPNQVMIMIACYDNPLYQSQLTGWHKVHYTAKTRRGTRTETIYMSYPAPTSLHDYRYLGNDFRERQNIRDKVKRHVARLKSLPVLERKAILNAFIEDPNIELK